MEILCGRYKGFIADLDHEMYLGSGSVEAFLHDMELDAQGLSRDQLMDMLCDPNSDLVWLHARDLQQFLNECVFCDEDLGCLARDADDLPADLQD